MLVDAFSNGGLMARYFQNGIDEKTRAFPASLEGIKGQLVEQLAQS